jgi:hypothetical protein
LSEGVEADVNGLLLRSTLGTMQEKGTIMIELTQEQRYAIAGAESPVVLDPETNEHYVLVRKAVYDRLRSLLDEDVRASGELVDAVMAEDDANDPYLESYQSITREKP